MPTPAPSIKFLIYGSGEEPRELTVYRPDQNIQFADSEAGSSEVAIGVQNLPDSPVMIHFPSNADREGFLNALRIGLYDWDPTVGPVNAWPESSGTAGAGSSMVLSNLSSGTEVATTTLEPTTTETTQSGGGGTVTVTTLNWAVSKTRSSITGTVKLLKNGSVEATVLLGNISGVQTGSFTYIGTPATLGIEVTGVSGTYSSYANLTDQNGSSVWSYTDNVYPLTFQTQDLDQLDLLGTTCSITVSVGPVLSPLF